MSFLEFREIYVYPLFISSYHSDFENILIFLSTNIFIAIYRIGVGRALESYLPSYPQ